MQTYKELGCQINSMPVTDLFEHYDQIGFLYPQKKRHIARFMPLIIKNWESALNAGEDILWVMSHGEKESGRLATLCVWRSTKKGAFSQHCTSTGHAVGTRAVLLGTQSKVAMEQKFCASQNWFQPTNKYANRVFGTIDRSIDEGSASVMPYNYLAVPLGGFGTWSESTKVVRCRKGNRSIYELASTLRGKVYADAEELADDDIELEELDEIYRGVGLSRKRHIWMAYCRPYIEPVAAVITYRGPVGFNFSLLENRCDLLVDHRLNDTQLESVCNALMKSAAVAYADFPFDYIPVVANDRCTKVFTRCGAKVLRQYNHSIWLREGMQGWYEHVRNILLPIEHRMKRQARKRLSVVQGTPKDRQVVTWELSQANNSLSIPTHLIAKRTQQSIEGMPAI